MSIKFLLPPKEQSQNSQQGQRAIPLPEYGGSLNYLLLTWDVHCCFLIKILLNQFSSIALSCPILCNPMDCSMPDLPVHHQHHKLAETHVRQVSGAIQPSHPLSPPSPPAFNPSQHQGLFQWLSSSHQVAKVLEFQRKSLQWIFRTDFLQDGLVGSPCSPRNSQESSLTPQFKSINSSALSFL